MVTFHENGGFSPNHVCAAISRRAVTNVGTKDGTALNHFPVLNTLENNFGFHALGKSDVTATPFSL